MSTASDSAHTATLLVYQAMHPGLWVRVLLMTKFVQHSVPKITAANFRGIERSMLQIKDLDG